MTTYVLDTSVFIAGRIPEDDARVTVPGVVDEVEDEGSRLQLDLAIDQGLRIEVPGENNRRRVLEEAGRTGDAPGLSDTDIDLLSKALEYEDAVIVTDDYAVQNVAARLNVQVAGISQPGIESVFEWGWRCTACGRRYEEEGVCRVCGSALKRYRRKRG